MQRLKVSWFLAAAFIGAVASLSAACGDTEASGSSAAGGGRCTPGKTEACVCTNGDSGAQTCKEDGTFSPCVCGDGGAGGSGGSGGGAGGGMNTKCGNGDIDMGEECDDGNTANGDGCDSLCKIETCPDGKPQPGECGPEGTCPADCGLCGNGMEDPFECGANGACPADCCLPQNTQIYASMIPSSGPDWMFGGKLGTDAGNDQCKTLGADHICDYLEVLEAEKQGELAVIPAGTTAWLHRTTDVIVGGVTYTPGAGARCNDWKYKTNHISDGEYVVFAAGGIGTYFFDNDAVFNQNDPPGSHTIPGQLECGGVTRAILCCFAQCVPPMP